MSGCAPRHPCPPALFRRNYGLQLSQRSRAPAALRFRRIKEVYLANDSGEVLAKKALMGALALYLDFINLFVVLLQLTGQRRE